MKHLTRTDLTTNLKVVRENPDLFMWGEVVKIHDIGEDSIVEYVDRSTTRFHVYVKGESMNASELSLDKALILTLCYKHLNHRGEVWPMHVAIQRILKIKEEE